MSETQQMEILALKEAGLRYISCTEDGYCRILKGKKFVYLDKKRQPISDERILERIKALVLPPAWTAVWICRHPNGHLQATGVDARGRKQYRYHPDWTSLRSEKKFVNLYTFGKRLPLLKKQLVRDLRKRSLLRDKVCALAIAVMDKTSFRAGNRSYEKANGSYGLTTLKNRHIKKISTNKLFFKFVGKKGVLQQSYLKEKSLVKLLLKVKEIPGQRIFQYYDEAGEIRALESGDINNYLKDAMKMDASCKNFRTWNGCLLALANMLTLPIPENKTMRKKNMLALIDNVAQTLGNTRTVTRSHYIHPRILQHYENGKLDSWIKKMQSKQEEVLDAAIKKKLFSLLKNAATD